MDYSLSEALKKTNITGLRRIILIYDIMCQYWKRLKPRMEESKYLRLPLGIAILHGIGLFHVGSHVWQCFSRFSLSFIPGASQVDGEILESLWSVLNKISPSTQNATISARIEMLDDHMGDSNFKKMLDIGECIGTLYAAAAMGPQWLPLATGSRLPSPVRRRAGPTSCNTPQT
jgi:hypothetical protein